MNHDFYIIHDVKIEKEHQGGIYKNEKIVVPASCCDYDA